MSRTNNKQTKAEHSEAYGIWHLAAASPHSIVAVAWYLIDKYGLAKTRINQRRSARRIKGIIFAVVGAVFYYYLLAYCHRSLKGRQ